MRKTFALIWLILTAFTFHAQVVTQADSNKGLVTWYECIGYAGGTLPTSTFSVFDSSQYGATASYAGTKAGNVSGTYYSTGAQVGPYACYFDGSTNYFDRSPLAGSTTPTSITIAAWVNPTSATQDVVTLTSLAGLVIYSGHVDAWVGSTTNTSRSTATIPTNGSTWTHIAMTYTNGGTLYLWINGVLVTSYATQYTGGATLGSFNVGYFGVSYYYGWGQGLYNDIRIYNRALIAGQMALLASAHN